MRVYIIFLALAVSSLTACKPPASQDKFINNSASVPPAFGVRSLGVITSSINKRQHTMATLYGNVVSVKRSRSGLPVSAGEKLLLVTWKQKPDENWFGANIPDEVECIEQITTANDPKTVQYLKYMGKPIAVVQDTTGQNSRIKRIFAMQPSIMP